MRNLKRALSLALATVMTLGLMVVGTGAAAVGYDDVTSEDNVEAIEVLQAVGIMTGDENGNFDPDGMVTRNQMAVIMSQLLNLNYDYYRGTNPFTDVPSWAAPYVAACAAEGVVAGIGDGLYGGENQVTAAQAALMILKALGYFQYEADFDGDWQVATIRQASYIRLFDGIDASAEEALTRNQIAQLVLNGLKSSMVTFTGDVGITVNGVVIGHRSEYTARTSADAQYDAIVGGTTDIAPQGQYIIQLGEELYDGDLRLQYTTDDFGRPARYWEYDGEEIGTYVREELLRQEYTAKVTGRDLYDLLGKATLDTYGLYVTIDGNDSVDIDGRLFDETSLNRSNEAAVGGTGNGVLTQVFVDTSAKEITIAIINTYLAFANEDYDAEDEKVDIDVYGITDKTGRGDYIKNADPEDGSSVGEEEEFTLILEDFAIENVLDGDAFLVTVADGKVQTIAEPELLSNVTISAFRLGSYVTVDGTKYDYATTTEWECETLEDYTTTSGVTNLKDMTYDVYLDAYGYAIGVDEVTNPDNYVFITGVDVNESSLSNTTLDANAIFLDGTMDTIKIDMRRSEFVNTLPTTGEAGVLNTWCTYSVNSNNVYTVTEVDGPISGSDKLGQYQDTRADSASVTIDDTHIWLNGDASGAYSRVYGNDETVYLTASVDEINDGLSKNATIIDDVVSVAIGIDNVNIEVWGETRALSEAGDTNSSTATSGGNGFNSKGAYVLYDDDYIIGVVVVGEDAGSSSNFVYVHSSSVFEESYDETTEEYTWTRNVISDGEEITLREVNDSGISLLSNRYMEEGKWYQVRYNADGEVTRISAEQTDTTAPDYDNDNVYGDWNLADDSGTTRYTNTLDNTMSGGSVTQYGAAVLVENAGVDTILYHEKFGVIAGIPTVDKNRSLYQYNNTTSGVRIANDTKVVLDQERNNDGGDVYFGTGIDDLVDFLNDLNAYPAGHVSAGRYNYDLSMVIEDGRVTSVIIVDNVGDGDGGTRPDVDTENYNVVLTGSTYTLEYRTGTYNQNDTEDVDTVLGMIMNDLTARGYGDFEISTGTLGTTYYIQGTNGAGVTRTFTWDSNSGANRVMTLVTINGEGFMVASGTDMDDITGANVTGRWALMTRPNGTTGWLSTGYTLTASQDGYVFETGYYKMNLSVDSSLTSYGNLDSGSSPIYVKETDTEEISLTLSGGYNQDRVFAVSGTNAAASYTGETAPVAADGKVTFTLTVSGVNADDNLTIKWTNPEP